MSHDKPFIRDAFAAIAPRYDLLNTLLSFGMEIQWRRRTVSALSPHPGERILDLCAGTFTLSRNVSKRSKGRALIIAADFCMEMMELGLRRLGKEEQDRILPVCGDAEALPLRSGVFDAVFSTYGIRNLENTVAGFREVLRLLKPGGRFVILEFLRPRNPLFSGIYRFYLRRVLPVIGGAVSGSFEAYRHLSDSIGAFMERERTLGLLEETGFEHPRLEVLTLGIAGIFRAQRPRTS